MVFHSFCVPCVCILCAGMWVLVFPRVFLAYFYAQVCGFFEFLVAFVVVVCAICVRRCVGFLFSACPFFHLYAQVCGFFAFLILFWGFVIDFVHRCVGFLLPETLVASS